MLGMIRSIAYRPSAACCLHVAEHLNLLTIYGYLVDTAGLLTVLEDAATVGSIFSCTPGQTSRSVNGKRQ